MKRVIASTMLGMALSFAPAASALPLQEVIENAKASVAHLDVFGSDGEEKTGSGFVISEDGKLVTNFHVVKDGDRVVATLSGGSKIDVAGVWAADSDVDLAVLQLAPGPYPVMALSESDPKQGDEVIVIGSPHGLAGSVSTGIVSAIRKEGAIPLGDDRRSLEGNAQSWGLQITAAISPGSSGSPVLDANGRVLGVAVGQFVGGQALNFAVPVSKLRDLVAGIRPGSQVKPLSQTTREKGRSVATNLLISGAVFGGLALVWWLSARIGKRRERTPRTALH